MHTDPTHSGDVVEQLSPAAATDALPIRVNPCESVSHSAKTGMTFKIRTMLFLAICAAATLVNLGLVRGLISFSLRHEYSTHILIIPFTSAALLLRNRARIFSRVSSSLLVGGSCLVIAVIILIWGKLPGFASIGEDALSLKVFAFVLLWIGGFLLSYGVESFKNALFPLLFLFFMVPIPQALIHSSVVFLQKGSAEASAVLFWLTGTPFHREGTTFILPRLSIEVAEQCSGIRSSLALLLSCLLAGYLILKTAWRQLVFVVVAIAMSIVKNAVRIVILSLLAIHVDMRFIVSSDLHREGGILFYLLGLLLLWPVLWLLHRSERKQTSPAASEPRSI